MRRFKIEFFRLSSISLLALLIIFIIPLTLASLQHFKTARISPEIGAVPTPASAFNKAQVSETFGRLPLSFEANRGQCDGPADFIARGPGYSLFLSATDATMALGRNESWWLRMRLKGANRAANVEGLEEAPGKSHYLLNRDPRRWLTGVSQFRKVRYESVYPGVDLVYYGSQRQLEYDFIVAPRSDPRAIKLEFEGAERIHVEAEGDLVLRVAGGEVRQRKPVIYQDVNGTRRSVEGGYRQTGAQEVSFAIAAYDHDIPLVIDPVIIYSTFLGGGSGDNGQSIALDAAGAIYVMGVTGSTNFPVTSQALKKTSSAQQGDIFVTKFNPAGSALVYSTYLGSDSSLDQGYGLAVDAAGAVYLTGRTYSADFPTTSGAAQTSFAGESDAFVAKLDATGSSLLYSTLLGGSHLDWGRGIAIDAAGNIYVTGQTSSSNFPTTDGALQRTLGNVLRNAFIARITAAGVVAYSTLYGSSAQSYGDAIVADSAGNAFVAGNVSSGAMSQTADNIFALKLNPTGTQLLFNFSPATSNNNISVAEDIVLDNAGNIYMTGSTTGGLTATAGAFQSAPGGRVDAFVLKLNAAGGLTYFTYLGGRESEVGASLALDGAGNICVGGWTISSDFPTLNAPQGRYGGGGLPFGDGFVTKFKADGTALVYSTFLGGFGNDAVSDLAVDGAGNAYVTGITFTPAFPVTPDAAQISISGQSDAFVMKIGEGPLRTLTVSAASYLRYAIARESLVAAFGPDLATGTESATNVPLPTSLAGTSIAIKDSAGVERLAPLFFVSPNQINYQIPPGAAPGTALVEVTNGNGVRSDSVIYIENVAPALFTVNASGEGAPAAVVLRVKPDNSQIFEPAMMFDAAQNRFVPRPLDFGQDELFLILFGSGLRFRDTGTPVLVGYFDPLDPRFFIGQADFAGAQGDLVALDQVNVRLPRSLAGAGEVAIRVTVFEGISGRDSNEVKVSFK